MAEQDTRDIQAALAAPFAPEDLEWRLQLVKKDKTSGLCVPYVTNRAIQSRLDDVVGAENWHNEYRPWHSTGKKESQICGISLYFEGRGWVTKWDGAEDSAIEPIKGGLSDSMKRAAVQWGIGRVLYNLDTVWADVEERDDSFVIKSTERPKLNRKYLDMLDGLHLPPAKPTGAQAQLTPTSPKGGDGSGEKARREQAQSATKDQPAPEAPMPPAEPDWDYAVRLSTIQRGMSGDSTSLTLLGRDGKKIQAFVRGAREDLVPGAKLRNVKLTQRRQDTVVFYVLESYEIAVDTETAA